MFSKVYLFIFVASSYIYSYSIIPNIAIYHLDKCSWYNVSYPCEIDTKKFNLILGKFNIATKVECIDNIDNICHNRQDIERVSHIGIIDSFIDTSLYFFEKRHYYVICVNHYIVNELNEFQIWNYYKRNYYLYNPDLDEFVYVYSDYKCL